MAEEQAVYEISLGQVSEDTKSEHESELDSDQETTVQGKRVQSLVKQLKNIPRDAQCLEIENDVPTDDEWAILGSHFTSIQNLEIDAGWDESLNDRLMPIHWPLKRLLMGSSCGEVTQNPHILLGRVQHLIFLFTAGIRFEGPTSEELNRTHRDAVSQGEKEEHYVGESGITITYQPTLVNEWWTAKYAGKEVEAPNATAETNPDINLDLASLDMTEDSEPINLTTFEILENDAMAEFIRFTMALPRLACNLRTLHIRSTSGYDLDDIPEDLFGAFLVQLDQLETLVLTVGDVFEEESMLPSLYKSFPEGLRTLRFRGPTSLIERADWDAWVAQFADPTYLPSLERLSFVCDMVYDPNPEGGWRRSSREATKDELRRAKRKCEQLHEAVRSRKNQAGGKEVEIEPFVEIWNSRSEAIKPINPEWDHV